MHLFLLFVGLVLCSTQPLEAAELEISLATVRMPPPQSDTAAAYMQIKNISNKPVVISSIVSNVAKVTELHSMRMEGDRMIMSEVKKTRIEVGATLDLSPSAMHLMLMDLYEDLRAGDQVMITFYLQSGKEEMVHALVQDMRNKSIDHDAMDMTPMKMHHAH
ncbi:MAG: copper chaperone PCu(A)C [Zetaproteobacteria bacterium]|nr:copper chaperone PCu(A)C [Zetaproteobacteria bacterium]